MKLLRLCILAAACSLGALSTARAANRILINNQTVPLGSTDNTLSILGDLDQPIFGFSVHFTYDAAKIKVTSVENGAAVAGLTPEYSQGTITPSPGRVVYGVVFDLSNPIDKSLSAGTGKELLKVHFDVLASTQTSVLVDLVNQSGNPSRLNVMANSTGDPVNPAPTLVDGTLTLSSLAPSIQNISPEQGTEGTEILIVGTNFNQAGLAVTICGTEVSHTLLADNQTVRVNAPACGTGPTDVKVCTDFGCDTEVGGFTYEGAPGAPIIDSFVDNSGTAGKEFLVIGRNFDEPGLAVMVCNANATFTLLADKQTLEVTAPACASEGWASVEVSTDTGQDTEVNGFFYEGGQAGTPFVRGDSNGDGRGDLSDAIFTLSWLFTGGATPPCLDAADANDVGTIDLSDPIFFLNFLFQGGGAPPPPHPSAGLDPTPDAIGNC